MPTVLTNADDGDKGLTSSVGGHGVSKVWTAGEVFCASGEEKGVSGVCLSKESDTSTEQDRANDDNEIRAFEMKSKCYATDTRVMRGT